MLRIRDFDRMLQCFDRFGRNNHSFPYGMSKGMSELTAFEKLLILLELNISVDFDV